MPSTDRPRMPDGYGVPDDDGGLIPWSSVEAHLIEATDYWLATTRPDGRPHVVPRWGVWVDGRFWYDGSPDTVHVRNLTAQPWVVAHIDVGPTKAVIVEGESRPSSPLDRAMGTRLSDAFKTKYAEAGYEPSPDSWSGPDAGGLCVLTPAKAMAWFDFPTDVTRFRF